MEGDRQGVQQLRSEIEQIRSQIAANEARIAQQNMVPSPRSDDGWSDFSSNEAPYAEGPILRNAQQNMEHSDDDDGWSDFSSNDSAFFRFNSAFQDGVKHALEFLSESN